MSGGFIKLTAWQKAYDLALEVYKETKKFPRNELYSLTTQMRRAAVSVTANIAEGYDRQSRKEYVHFLVIARGSLAETEAYLLFARDLGYLPIEHYAKLDGIRQELGRVLRGLINSLRS